MSILYLPLSCAHCKNDLKEGEVVGFYRGIKKAYHTFRILEDLRSNSCDNISGANSSYGIYTIYHKNRLYSPLSLDKDGEFNDISQDVVIITNENGNGEKLYTDKKNLERLLENKDIISIAQRKSLKEIINGGIFEMISYIKNGK